MPAPASAPVCLVIAGPNGAGKSTFARQYLLQQRGIDRFINADLIATGLSPLKPELAAVAAGRLLLREWDRLAARRVSFAVESTLSGLGYLARLRRLKRVGYRVEIIYLALGDARLALSRVKARVLEGGHAVPAVDVRRRFARSRKNFEAHYPSARRRLVALRQQRVVSRPSAKILMKTLPRTGSDHQLKQGIERALRDAREEALRRAAVYGTADLVAPPAAARPRRALVPAARSRSRA